MRALSGNHAGWLATTAKEVREAGKPVSLDYLLRVVPGQFATSTNDGHVTAAENGLDRNDYQAGQRIWIEETVAALRKAGLVEGDDDALVWAVEQNGVWKVPFRSKIAPTVYGRAESAAGRDRHMLGDSIERPGYLLKGWSEVEVEIEVGIANVIEKGKHTMQVHPFAFAIPPMSPEEQAMVRADIERYGVRQPLVLYPDETDRTARGKAKHKVLDGRHRLQFASALGKPVRVELFEGNEEEARAFVASLNLFRRQMSKAQRALAIEQLFGEQARREAQAAKNEGWKERENLRANPPGDNKPESEPSRWENRAVKLAGGNDTGVSPRSVRAMAEVSKAPETMEKVFSGEIKTVSAAANAAAVELGRPNPTPVWKESVTTDLGRARSHLRDALAHLRESDSFDRIEDVKTLLIEIDQLCHDLRHELPARSRA